jgi:amino acid transporter
MAMGQGEAAEELSALGYKQELKRSLSLVDLVVYGLVFISPVAPWAVFGSVYNLSHGMAPLVYGIGLVAMAFTAFSYMTMVEAYPIAGSVYAYAGRAIAPWAGFLAGWALLLDYLLIPTLAYVVAVIAIHEVWPDIPKWELVTGFVVGVTVANLAGIEATTGVNKLLLLIQTALLVVFLILAGIAIANGVGGAHLSTAPLYQPSVVSPGLVFGALSVAALSFLGFDAISTLAEEAKGGPRQVSAATFISLVLAAALFAFQTYVASLFVLGKASFAHGAETEAAFLRITGLVGGAYFKDAASVGGLALSAVAGAVVAQAACARLLYGMARDRQLPRFLAHISGKRQSPDVAILFIGVLSLILGLAFVNYFEQLAQLVNFGALTGFLALHLSVIVYGFRRRESFNLFRHLVSPVLGFGVIGYVLWNMHDEAKILGLSWLGIGVLALIWLKIRGRKPELPGG